MFGPEEGDDPKVDSARDYKKQGQKEFNFLYAGPPIKIKRGFQKLTQAMKDEEAALKSPTNTD
jgi:hypothetical protein